MLYLCTTSLNFCDSEGLYLFIFILCLVTPSSAHSNAFCIGQFCKCYYEEDVECSPGNFAFLYVYLITPSVAEVI
jgi:hypothetical protein